MSQPLNDALEDLDKAWKQFINTVYDALYIPQFAEKIRKTLERKK
jgi:hypothetical protein